MGMLMYDALVLSCVSKEIARRDSCLTLGVPTLNFTDQSFYDQVRSYPGLQDILADGKPFQTASEFFKLLGFSEVSALDISDYEGANIVADLNDPDLPSKVSRQFDLVYDSGTIEHIFDAPTALRSIAKLVKVGGAVVHATPCNGFVDHGFWQVSPDLYKAFYAHAGFDILTVALFVFAETPYAIPISDNIYRTKGRKYIAANAAEAILVFAAKKTRECEVTKIVTQDYYTKIREGDDTLRPFRFFLDFGQKAEEPALQNPPALRNLFKRGAIRLMRPFKH